MNKNFELSPLLNVLVDGTSHSLLNFGYFLIALSTVYSISGVCLRHYSCQFLQQSNDLLIDVFFNLRSEKCFSDTNSCNNILVSFPPSDGADFFYVGDGLPDEH